MSATATENNTIGTKTDEKTYMAINTFEATLKVVLYRNGSESTYVNNQPISIVKGHRYKVYAYVKMDNAYNYIVEGYVRDLNTNVDLFTYSNTYNDGNAKKGGIYITVQ